MPNFRYIVVNKENRQLSGVVDAPNADVARQELKDLGFSIVSLEKSAQEEEKKHTGVVFEFAGIDAQNKNVSGTIRSESRYQAFRRLITEYELDVQYVVESDLKEKEKAAQQKEGVISLMKKYQEEVKSLTQKFHEKKIKKIDRTFEKEKALIMRQVDYVLKKVNSAVDTFGKELNPQDKQTIISYVNKILRLKNTTNLDYLKTTCKSLLEYLQNAEIFTHRKGQLDEKMRLYADSKDMIETIDKGKDFGLYEDLEDQIVRWRSEHIKGKGKVQFSDKLKDVYYSTILKIIHEGEETRTLKKELHHLNRELKQYYSIYIKAKDPTFRKEASVSIKKLREKKKKLKHDIRVTRKKERSTMHEEFGLTGFEAFIDIIRGLSGWLLFFYLIYYFTSAYLITKQLGFPGNELPSFLYLFDSGAIKYLLPVVFLLHSMSSLKIIFFKRNAFANILLVPIFLLTSLVVVFNF
ncbi:hypothetical protein ACFL3C_03500 [Patescibacteria group bacterium]